MEQTSLLTQIIEGEIAIALVIAETKTVAKIMHNHNNPPAFPQALAVGPAGDIYASNDTPCQSGMTLRDWFAGMALQSVVPMFVTETASIPSLAAEEAYRVADAMIAERSKQ